MMIALGFTNFIPIKGGSESGERIFGLPILNINASSVNIVKNVFGCDTTRLLPIDCVQPIRLKPAQKQPAKPQKSASTSQLSTNADSDSNASPLVSLRGLLMNTTDQK